MDGMVVVGGRESDVGIGMGDIVDRDGARRLEFTGKIRGNMKRNVEIEIGRKGSFDFNEGEEVLEWK